MTPTNRNRLKLLGIAAVAIAPIVGSYLLYWFWLPGQQTNYGTLISPRTVPELTAPLIDGTAFSMKQLRGKWALVVVDSGECAKDCQEKLWKVRQVRLTQGKEMGRIERVWLIDDDRSPSPELLGEYAGTWAVKAHPGPLVGAIEPKGRNPRDHIYLVDPLGYVMMRFPPAAEPRGMMKDLGRLLKYSRTG